MNPASAPQSICIVRLSALGDVVLVVPLIRALQRQWPGVHITWVIGRMAHEAVASLSTEGVDFVVVDKPKGLGDYLNIRRLLAHRHFDALLCLQASWRANWIYPFIKANRKIGYGRDRAKDFHAWFVRESIPPAKPHLVDGFLQFGEALGVQQPLKAEWNLGVHPAAEAWVDLNLPPGPFIAISPCASKPERDWPLERYAQVLQALHQRKAGALVLLGGPTKREREFVGRLVEQAAVPVVNLVGQTRIPQLLSVLRRCSLLLAPDTGAVHIARAFGRPVVGLYAVAPASRTGPYGRYEYCVDRFDEGVRSLLGKDPAKISWAKRVHHPAAMKLISVDDVLARIDAVLGKEL